MSNTMEYRVVYTVGIGTFEKECAQLDKNNWIPLFPPQFCLPSKPIEHGTQLSMIQDHLSSETICYQQWSRALNSDTRTHK